MRPIPVGLVAAARSPISLPAKVLRARRGKMCSDIYCPDIRRLYDSLSMGRRDFREEIEALKKELDPNDSYVFNSLWGFDTNYDGAGISYGKGRKGISSQ
mgnify:CR=1 FL=1